MDIELQKLVADVGSAAKGLVDSAARDVRAEVAEGMARLRQVEDEVRALSLRWDDLTNSDRPVRSRREAGTARTVSADGQTCEVLAALTRLVEAIKAPAC